MSESYLHTIEKEFMTGKGRWIADFKESFRNFKIKDVVFDMFISGNMRAKGFLLSRIFSYLFCPNYSLGCFVFQAKRKGQVDRSQLSKLLDAIKSHMKKKELRWSWLILLQQGYTNSFKNHVEKLSPEDIGIVLYDTDSRKLTYNSPLGKHVAKYVFPKKLLK